MKRSGSREIAIIDYEMGNIASVRKALFRVGCLSVVTADHDRIRKAAGVVLPGVGAFADGIKQLEERGLVPVIKDIISQGKPFLGICIGMHLLMEEGSENGFHQGLGIIKGKVVRFHHDLKIPQTGWNTLNLQKPSPLFEGIKGESYVYFVHSYHILPQDTSIISATTDYGYFFVSSINRGNLFATQFHPEKSQEIGLKILRNFADICFSADTPGY